MSFDAFEASLFYGSPQRLYLFERGAWSWAYCAADRDLALLSRHWSAIAITDDGIRQTGEPSADALKITLPGDLPVPQLYRGAPPSAEVWLTVRDYHWGDTDTLSSMPVVWIGTISSVSWPQVDRAEISCAPLSSSMDRLGLSLSYLRACPHALFDRNCGVDRSAFGVSGVIVALDGQSIEYSSAAALADGRAAGGFIEWAIGLGETERRSILSHSGSVLVLLGGTQGLAPGQAITVYPGCRQTTDDCAMFFDNLLNYGGFPALPGTSPFDGNPVF